MGLFSETPEPPLATSEDLALKFAWDKYPTLTKQARATTAGTRPGCWAIWDGEPGKPGVEVRTFVRMWDGDVS